VAERIRWRLWALVIRLPMVCPSQAHSRLVWRLRDRSIRIDPICRLDADRNGSCYCGKVRTCPPATSTSEETAHG